MAITNVPVDQSYVVLPQVIYDWLIAGTDDLDTNVTKWLGTACSTPTVAGVPNVDILNIFGTILSAATSAQLSEGFSKFFNVSSPTGTVNSLPDAVPEAAGGLPISTAGSLELDTKLAAAAYLTQTRMELLDDWINGGRLDLIIDAILADTAELQTDDIPGKIVTLDAVVDTVKAETALIVADTAELQTDDIPGKIAALDAVVDTVPGLVWDEEVVTAHNTSNTAGLILENLKVALLDAITELTAGNAATEIPATPAAQDVLRLLYATLRNTMGGTATERGVYDNSGTKILKATMVTNEGAGTFYQGKLGDA